MVTAGKQGRVDKTTSRRSRSRLDRRELLTRGASLGLALPLGLRAVNPTAQEDNQDDMAGMDSDEHNEAPVATQAVQPFAFYDPVLPAVQAGPKDVTIVARDVVKYVAQEVVHAGWSYDGTIPGRTLRVVEGDTVDVTFKVDSAANAHHSLDLHSSITPPDQNYRTIEPGEEMTWSFVADFPGTFMYHCGTPKILMHIASGLYGAIVVDPKEGWPQAQEFGIVQSEFYFRDGGSGVMVPDATKMLGGEAMDYCVFNGYANQYVENPIKVEAKVPIRVFVVNAGPNVWSSFHVVGTIFSRVLVNGNPKNALFGLQSVTIGPGDGAVVELTLPRPGNYPFVNHAFAHASHGAVGVFQAE